MTAKTTWQSGQTPGSQPLQTNNGVTTQQPADDFDIINYMGDTQTSVGESEGLADGANDALSTSISSISDVMNADMESSHMDETEQDLQMLEEEDTHAATADAEENTTEGTIAETFDDTLTDLNAIDTATSTPEDGTNAIDISSTEPDTWEAWDVLLSADVTEPQAAETSTTTDMQSDQTQEEEISFDDINLDDTAMEMESDTQIASDVDTHALPEDHMTQDISEVSENGSEVVHDDSETEEDLEDILTEPDSLEWDTESVTLADDQTIVSDTAPNQTELEPLTSEWTTLETEQTTSSPENGEQPVEEIIKNDEIGEDNVAISAETKEGIETSPEIQAPWTELSDVEIAPNDSSIEAKETTTLTEAEGDATTQEIVAASDSEQAGVEGDPLGLWDIQLETTKRTSMFNGEQTNAPDEPMQVVSASEEVSDTESKALPDIDLSAIDEFELPTGSTTTINSPEGRNVSEEPTDITESMMSWNSFVDWTSQAADLTPTSQEQQSTLPNDGTLDEATSFEWAIDQASSEVKSFDETTSTEMIPESESYGQSETELSSEGQQVEQQNPTVSEPSNPIDIVMPPDVVWATTDANWQTDTNNNVTTEPTIAAANEPSLSPTDDMMELHANNEIDAETKSSIESKLAAVSRLSENLDTEGINLDSLIPEVAVDDLPPVATPNSAGYTITDVTQKVDKPVANKKSLKIILATLWVLAAGGAMYFGYLVLEQNGMIPSISSLSSAPNTDDTQIPTNENTGSIVDQLSDSSGDTMGITEDSGAVIDGSDQTQDMTDTDDQIQVESPLEPDPIAVDDDMTTWSEDPTPVETYVATKSRDEILTIGNLLVARSQKLATLAATKQNASAKMEAGSIYQDAQKLLQLLENDANIDTLGKIEHDMNAVVQRFISLAQQLNGTTR